MPDPLEATAAPALSLPVKATPLIRLSPIDLGRLPVSDKDVGPHSCRSTGIKEELLEGESTLRDIRRRLSDNGIAEHEGRVPTRASW